MTDRPRRLPSLTLMAGVLLLVGPLAVAAWYFQRPPALLPPPGPPLDELDIVCTGRVDVPGQVTHLELPQPGRVSRVSVAEGDTVKRGQEILAIEDTTFALAVREAEAARTAAQVEVELAQQRQRAWPSQLTAKQLHLAALQAEADAATAKRNQLRSQQSLTSAVATADVAVADAGVRKLTALAEAETVSLTEMQKADAALEVRAAQAKRASADVAVERARQAKQDCILAAPEDGTILRLQAAVGGRLSSLLPGGAPAVVFAPAGPRIVRAELEQANLLQARVGMTAVLRDDSRADGPRYDGTLTRIAGWVAARRSLLLEPGEINDVRTTEAIIELRPGSGPLWIGQRLQVRLVRGGSPPPTPDR